MQATTFAHHSDTNEESLVSTLPAGYSVRPARLEEAAKLVVPMQLIAMRYMGEPEPSVEEFANDLQDPGLNLETDSRAVWAPDGTCAGYVEVLAAPPYLRNFIWGATHPEHEGKGIGSFLYTWALERAREFVPLADEDKRVVAVGNCFANEEPAIQLMRDQGLELVRRFYEMRINMDAAPVVPPIPNGFTIRTMDIEQDTENLYRAIDDAFRDHYGYVERPFDVGLERWKHYNLETEHFDPNLVLIAETVDSTTGMTEIAGFSVNYPDANDPVNRGHLHQIGVRRPWRRQGLANYLLYKTFEVHWNRGAKTVLLGVDATNPTGALDLYKKAGMYEFASGVAMEIILRDGAPPLEE